ncbi:MAG TPA: hypothetical protein DIU39_03180 [Flavobacteriales bacterium]|jgi:hypothetical protein|nr:hypothetical protein [Flavobacteriales bacterium]|tara:strand:+ start:3707 stop:4393 length:687 start_codon:yes stop_codon:yes gene_type:complete
MIKQQLKKIIYVFFLTPVFYSCQQICLSNKDYTFSKDSSIIFLDTYYFFNFSYDSCGEFQSFQKWDIDQRYITISTITPLDSNKDKYFPIRFVLFNQSIYLLIKHIDSNIEHIDTVKQFQFKHDTIECLYDFRINSKEYNSSYANSVYTGDTVLTIDEYKFNCYRFLIIENWKKTFPGPSKHKKIIFIDKKTLYPVLEKDYAYYRRHFCFPVNKWFLQREIKMIQKDN